MEPLLSLSELQDGAAAVVAAYDPWLPPGFRRRLEELGLTPGTAVRREGRAPLGDPLLIRVRGTLLSIRRSQACAVRVRQVRP